MPRRRTVLASLGAIALTGCTGRETGDAAPATDATPTPSPTGTVTTTPTEAPEPDPPSNVKSDWPTPDHDAGGSRYTAATDGPTDSVGSLWRTPIDATPSPPIVADGLLYVGDTDGILHALDARTGTERWRVSVGATAGAPRFLNGRLYVPTDDAVVAVAADDGTSVWRTDAPDRTGLLVTGGGVYYVSRGDEPAVVALAIDGSERWRATMDGPWQSPLFAGDGYVFVSTGLYWSEPWVFDSVDGTYRGEHRPRNGADMTSERFHIDGRVVAADGFFGDVETDDVVDGRYDRIWKTALDAYAGFKLAGGAERCFLATTGGDEPGLYAL